MAGDRAAAAAGTAAKPAAMLRHRSRTGAPSATSDRRALNRDLEKANRELYRRRGQ